MKYIISVMLFLQAGISFSRQITLTGKAYAFSSNLALIGAVVNIGKSQTTCDSTGKFILTVNKCMLNDTLTIKSIGLRQLNIENIPSLKDTIDLGEVQMFQGFRGYDQTDFFCHWINFRCKHEAKEYWKDREAENKTYVAEVNNTIDSYRYRFNDKYYKMQYNNDYYHLKVLLDLAKPEK